MITANITVFAVMNVLYFMNVIPPIPLSLRDAGMYHDIVRADGAYTLVGEEESWSARLVPGQIIESALGDQVYAYTAIFAPIDFSTTIYHRRQVYDEVEHAWITRDRLSFTISGGRDAGYRGYSMKTSLTPGRWRVTVETARGQVLGRIPFRFVEKID